MTVQNLDPQQTQSTSQRLYSLDCLRGFDIFVLIALQPILMAILRKCDSSNSVVRFLTTQFQHCSWEGFTAWDLVMPLFMFMSGITIPLVVEKHFSKGGGATTLWIRILRRVVVLWILGMVVQGNLLAWSWNRLYVYSNTLQAIAMGCLIAFGFVMLIKKNRYLIASAFGLLIIFWLLMTCVTINGYGGGNFTPSGNLAEYIDRLVLGRFRDGAHVAGGQVVFAGWYHYTWILSSINFGAIVLFGSIAGKILLGASPKLNKTIQLIVGGAILIALGWLWNFHMPIIKPIFSSSMVCLSAGLCCWLLAGFYFVFDVIEFRIPYNFLPIIGSNAIVAYILHERFGRALHPFVQEIIGGAGRFMGMYQQAAVHLGEFLIIMAVLIALHKMKIYVKA